MHRSNNSSAYPLFERLFAVILSVTDIKDITFVSRINGNSKKETGTVEFHNLNLVDFGNSARIVWLLVRHSARSG